MRVLITGTAGFIGFHQARRLLLDGHEVVGFDGMTPYYDVSLKLARHAELEKFPRFRPVIGMLEEAALVRATVAEAHADVVLHFAAQAGVRYSLDHPDAYVSSNLVGTLHLLEALRATPPRHFLFASTSSVYGGNQHSPFAETDRTDYPLSVYAATKRGAESLSHSYAHLFAIPTTCFRFFTVYGPWGRPDMALFRFVEAIEKGEPIDVYGGGRMARDFTYISDLVEAVTRLIDLRPVMGSPVEHIGVADTLSPVAPWRAVNIAGGQSVSLPDFIDAVERALGRTAIRTLLPMQSGDVAETRADHRLLEALTGFRPSTSVDAGVAAFVDWYRIWKAGL